MFNYKIGIGYAGIVLETYTLRAKNLAEARSLAIRKYLHPDKGYDHVVVTRIK